MLTFAGKNGKTPKYLSEKAKAQLEIFWLQRDKLMRNISNSQTYLQKACSDLLGKCFNGGTSIYYYINI